MKKKGRYFMDYSRVYADPYDVVDKAREHVIKVKEQNRSRRIAMLETGIKGHEELIITQELTAKNMGSGVMDVFATPAMLALMEKTAFTSVVEYLNEGCGSVGTKVEIEHVASSPVGMRVTCDSELIAIEGRKLVFSIEARDEKGLIGKGMHERFIIENKKFQQKTDAKLNN